MAISSDGKTGYIADMKNRRLPTTRNNIDLGWVLGQRLTRVPLDGPATTFDTLSLDTRGKAAADAHGVAVSRDQKYVAVSCGGTHEVMIFRTDKPPPLAAQQLARPDRPELLKNDGRYRRVELGGRPTELAFAPAATCSMSPII